MTGEPSAAVFDRASQVWYTPPSGAKSLAGAAATMPSKSPGYRWASSSASRPPLEQPVKNACRGGAP
jgi:hypothetical protein